MDRPLFLVAQTGGKPTYIFQSQHHAEAVLSDGTGALVEFWWPVTGPAESNDGRWTGWLASGDEVARLLGWVPEAVLDAAA
jgi:hypothetical protein